jgi:hypothetical protein
MKILHLLREPPGKLFYQVVGSQKEAHQLTIILFPEVGAIQEELPGRVAELVKKSRSKKASPGAYPRISHGELLDFIFQHDKVFCW